MRILFITCSRLGDAVLTTNVLNYLVQTYPQAKYTIVTNELTSSIFEAVPNLEKLIKVEKSPYKLHWFKIWWKVFFMRWDKVVDLRNTVISRILFSKKTYIKQSAPNLHKIQENIKVLGITENIPPKIWISDEVYARVSEYVSFDEEYICIAPTANWIGKEWPPEYFAKLIIKMMDSQKGFLPKMPIVVLGAKHERERILELFEILKQFDVLDRVGVFEPIESAACIAKAKFFIGNDSGLMHISWAMNTKTFALFGPGFPNRYGPLGIHAHIIETDTPSVELREQASQSNLKGQSLMLSLPVEKVFKSINKNL